jgi:hypothetical protein
LALRDGAASTANPTSRHPSTTKTLAPQGLQPRGTPRVRHSGSAQPTQHAENRASSRTAAGVCADLNPVEGLWSSLKAVELANLTGPTLAEVIIQAHHGIERVRRTLHLAYSFLRRPGLSAA